MKYLVRNKEMKECDSNTISKFQMPSLVLMERSAMAVVKEMKTRAYDCAQVCVVCGTGNNGGDGIAIARLLHLEGVKVEILIVGEEETGSQEFSQQLLIARNYGVPIVTNGDWKQYTVIVDAIFGIGLTRNVEGLFAQMIQDINEAPAPVVAVDIPSGISGDDGKIKGVAVKADCTITFAYGKPGLFLYPGAEYAGEVILADIGIYENGFEKGLPKIRMLEEEDEKRLLPARYAYSNKGSYGKVLVIAGSVGMSGAAYFSACAAYRMGVGLVRILTPFENRVVLQQQLPEALFTGYQLENMNWTEIKESIQWATTIVLGPGIGQSQEAEQILEFVLSQAEVPLVIDADGINLLARHRDWMTTRKGPLIVTPHLKEMERLTGSLVSDIADHIMETASEFAEKNNCICVLKDARTIIAGEDQIIINTTGNHGMATGGSGDVLSGMIGGLLAQKMNPLLAAALGVRLHGKAGDKACKKKGPYAMIARDILDEI